MATFLLLGLATHMHTLTSETIPINSHISAVVLVILTFVFCNSSTSLFIGPLMHTVCDYSMSCLYQQICTAVPHIPVSQGLLLFTTLTDDHSSRLSLTQPPLLPISSSV